MSARRTFRALFAAILAAGSAVCVAHAQQIGLQPTRVEVETAPGTKTRQVVTLSNTNRERPVSVSLHIADWSQDEAGAIAFSPAGESDASAAGWARLPAATLTLAPGQSKQVRIGLATPEALARTGDYRFALVASSVQQDTAGTWQKRQIASLFYVTAGKAASRPEITGGRLTVTEAGAPAIGLDLRNTGNAHARLDGVIEIRGDGGALVSVPVRDLIVPEGASRRYLAPLNAPLPANPVIDVRLDNVFAPQEADETRTLAPYRVRTETELSSLSAPVGGLN